MRKATISFVLSVRPSVRPSACYLSIFRKNCRYSSSFIKILQEWWVLYMKTNVRFWSYLAQFWVEWEMFQTKAVEKIKTHISFSITFFFRKAYHLWDNVENMIVQPVRLQMTTMRMRITCCIPKATNIHTHIMYYLLLFHCNNGYASMLRYTYSACLVVIVCITTIDWNSFLSVYHPVVLLIT